MNEFSRVLVFHLQYAAIFYSALNHSKYCCFILNIVAIYLNRFQFNLVEISHIQLHSLAKYRPILYSAYTTDLYTQ